MSEDLLNTPIDDIINNRAKLLGLATNLFNRTSPAVIRAFGQFGRNPDLAKVIEAKRKGVFDYGACIQDTPTGTRWPTDTIKVLEAIDKAERGTLTVDDLTPIFAGNRDVAEDLYSKVFPRAPSTPQRTKKPVVEQIHVEEQAQPEPENVVPFKQREPAQAPTNTLETSVSNADFDALRHAIKELTNDLEVAHAWHDARIKIVIENQIALNHNLKQIASCLGDLPLMDVTADKSAAAAVRIQPVEDHQNERPAVAAAPVRAQAHVPEITPPAADTFEEEEFDVTEDLLNRLDLGGLRTLGVRLGIKNADQMTYPKVLRKKIRAAVGLPPVTD